MLTFSTLRIHQIGSPNEKRFTIALPFRNATVLMVLLFLTVPLCRAQNTGKLSGIVTDAETNEPMPGATILIEDTHLGTSADPDGNYVILGVPVGRYTLQVSFVGYDTYVLEDLEINAGYTREIDFALRPTSTLLDELVVEYERPLIQRDAIGVPRVFTAEKLENISVRGVEEVAALQSGVVIAPPSQLNAFVSFQNRGLDEDESEKNIIRARGGRAEEIVYFIDGVKVIGRLGIPQAAIQEQSMLIGGIPARYGDAASGVISVTTRSGSSNWFGSVEALSSEGLDPYGYNLGSASLGGPILSDRVHFFVASEYLNQADRDPRAIQTPRLNDERLQFVLENPQVLQIRHPTTGEIRFVSLPGDLPGGLRVDDILAELDVPEGFVPDYSELLVDALAVEPVSSYIWETARSNFSREELRLNGNITVDATDHLRFRVGGRMVRNDRRQFQFQRMLYNSTNHPIREVDSWNLYGNLTHHLSNSTFYQVQFDYSNTRDYSYPAGTSRDIRDLTNLFDIDDPLNAPYARIKGFSFEDSTLVDRNEDGSFHTPSSIWFFQGPGARSFSYSRSQNQQFRLSGQITTQIGIHQLEFGGEYEQRLERFYSTGVGPAKLAARLWDDGSPEQGDDGGIDAWDELAFDAIYNSILYWGYNYTGTRNADSDNVEAFVNGESYDVAPRRPIYYAGYFQDKIEYKDIVLNLGLRLDVFDNNTRVLTDRYSLFPIIRAGSLSSRPASIGNDYAVYYDRRDEVVGFRDLDGTFYDARGEVTLGDEVVNELGGTPRIPEGQSRQLSSSLFEDYKPQVTLMPRVGVSFSVTDRALFFAHYDVTSQRPYERAFEGLSEFYANTQGRSNGLNNAGLEPIRTTEYELGFKQRITERAAITLSGFYKQIHNLIQIRNLTFAFPSGYNSYENIGSSLIKGLELGFELRRTNNLAVDANYTLQFARGTGSWPISTIGLDPDAPRALFPLNFDQRHSLNVTLDYRLGSGEGPSIGGRALFEHFGFNMVAYARSGLPYTRHRESVALWDRSSPAGYVNEEHMPWINQVNLRIDRMIPINDRIRLRAFLWVQNLFDVDNPVTVYPATGLPDNDGWLETPGGRQWVADEPFPEISEAMYQYALLSPFNYSIPRLTRLGLRLTF